MSRYEYNKRWRIKNPLARNVQRQRYYHKHSSGPKGGDDWTLKDEQIILDPNRPCDVILSQNLGRSVRAIQIKRSRIKNKTFDNADDSPVN